MKFFIPTRDRHVCLERLLEWLKNNGQDPGETFLVDMVSTYGPMKDLLSQWSREGYRVMRMDRNMGARGLFKHGVIKAWCPKGAFFLSDPDIVP